MDTECWELRSLEAWETFEAWEAWRGGCWKAAGWGCCAWLRGSGRATRWWELEARWRGGAGSLM